MGANILTTEREKNDKDAAKKSQRIMICDNDIEAEEARAFAERYNCRVIGESWIVQCIYPDQDSQGSMMKKSKQPYVDYYEMDPVMERRSFDDFDQTQKQD